MFYGIYVFLEIFSLGEFHNSPNFLLPICSCNEFAKFPCCQSFPPYGKRVHGNSLIKVMSVLIIESIAIIICYNTICIWYYFNVFTHTHTHTHAHTHTHTHTHARTHAHTHLAVKFVMIK